MIRHAHWVAKGAGAFVVLGFLVAELRGGGAGPPRLVAPPIVRLDRVTRGSTSSGTTTYGGSTRSGSGSSYGSSSGSGSGSFRGSSGTSRSYGSSYRSGGGGK